MKLAPCCDTKHNQSLVQYRSSQFLCKPGIVRLRTSGIPSQKFFHPYELGGTSGNSNSDRAPDLPALRSTICHRRPLENLVPNLIAYPRLMPPKVFNQARPSPSKDFGRAFFLVKCGFPFLRINLEKLCSVFDPDSFKR